MLCFACDADRQQPPKKLKFRWDWIVIATLAKYGRSLNLGASYILSYPTNRNELFDMATLMVLSAFAILLIVRPQGR
jgi:hypothetical protein